MKKNFWEKRLKEDEMEIGKINRAVRRKDRKFLEKWFDRYNKEGDFWNKSKTKKNWL